MADEKKPPVPGKVPPPLPSQRPGQTPPAVPGRPPMPGGFPKAGAPGTAAPAVPRPPSAPAAPAAPRDGASSEIDEMKSQMQSQIFELQQQLQGEREKLLMQTVRAKEEEAMASKVEESLKDIQDRLRREKREQELLDQLAKSEGQMKELEQRLLNERQTWVETFRTQLSQKESQEKELEHGFEVRLKELERRWHEEKLNWAQTLRDKEGELIKLKRVFEAALSHEKQEMDKRLAQVDQDRESLKRELKDNAQLRQEERETLVTRLEARDKEYMGLKAQQAMLGTQVRQEKEKIEQLKGLIEKMKAEKGAMAGQMASKEKEFFLLKTQFAMFQTRSKADQEKLLKELVLFKDQVQAERQKFEIGLKSRQDEIELLKRTGETRETELRQQIDRKDHELSALVRQYEERMKAREGELQHIWDRKEADFRETVRQWEDRVQVKEQEFLTVLNRKDEEIKTIQAQWNEKERDFRIAGLHAEQKARELEAKAETLTRAYEDKLAALSHSFQEQLGVRDRELTAERERASQRENHLQTVITQKESELKKEQALWTEKLEAREHELAELHDREKTIALELEQAKKDVRLLQDETAAKGREINASAAQVRQKDEELAKYEARERNLKASLDLQDQKAARFQQDLEARTRELAAEKERSAQRENEFKREQLQLADRLQMKEQELAGLLEREREFKSQVSGYELRLRDLEEKNGTLGRELSATRERSGGLEKETHALRQQFETDKRTMAEQFNREREALLSQSAAKDAVIDQLKHKQEEIRNIGDIVKLNFESEVRKLENELKNREREIERAKNESLIREKDLQLETRQKESRYQQDISKFEEKVQYLEKAAAGRQEEFDRRLAQYQDAWRQKEQGMASETASQAQVVAALRNDLMTWYQQKEKLIGQLRAADDRGRSEVERVEGILRLKNDELERVRQEFMSMEERLRGEMEEKYRQAVLDLDARKEAEVLELKTSHQFVTEQMRRELEDQFSTRVVQLEREKAETGAGMAQELEAVRRAMEQELLKMEEQLNGERDRANEDLLLAQQAMKELEDQLEGAKRQLEASESTHGRENESRLEDSRRKWEQEKKSMLVQIQALEASVNEYAAASSGDVGNQIKEAESRFAAERKKWDDERQGLFDQIQALENSQIEKLVGGGQADPAGGNESERMAQLQKHLEEAEARFEEERGKWNNERKGLYDQVQSLENSQIEKLVGGGQAAPADGNESGRASALQKQLQEAEARFAQERARWEEERKGLFSQVQAFEGAHIERLMNPSASGPVPEDASAVPGDIQRQLDDLNRQATVMRLEKQEREMQFEEERRKWDREREGLFQQIQAFDSAQVEEMTEKFQQKQERAAAALPEGELQKRLVEMEQDRKRWEEEKNNLFKQIQALEDAQVQALSELERIKSGGTPADGRSQVSVLTGLQQQLREINSQLSIERSYRQQIEMSLNDERRSWKEEKTRLTDQLQDLTTVQPEAVRAAQGGQGVDKERYLLLEQELSASRQALDDARKQLDEMTRTVTVEHRQLGEAETRFTEERRLWESQKEELSGRLRALEEAARTAEPLSADEEDTRETVPGTTGAAVEPQMYAGDPDEKPGKGVNTLIGKFWNNLNETVFEIGKKEEKKQ